MNDAPQLLMRRKDLDGLPALELPPGVALRPFRENDGAHWERIVNAAFGRKMTFDGKMRTDPAFRPERILFLETEGRPAAVAAAWYREAYGPDAGYLHYVAVLPEAQGQRLGYWVTLAALRRMRDEGFARAALQTDDERIPAIKTYLRLEFQPDEGAHESYPERWKAIRREIKAAAYTATESNLQ
ncbi:MAG: GNAT family N-acetyltransferase [Oscillospiraceae bacterium]|jgi:mycothiol synthase|nr:GNAT family N-acetyltransferase [Oscillospiraceae bacterium]